MGQTGNTRQASGTMSSQPVNARRLKEPIERQGWADWKKQSISLPFTRDALNREDVETATDTPVRNCQRKRGWEYQRQTKRTSRQRRRCINMKKRYSGTASAHKNPQLVFTQ